MAQYREYAGPSVGNPLCSYTNLANTYHGQAATAVPNMSNYVVPKLCPDGPGPSYPPRYDTFSHGQKYLCGGYFGLNSAYPYADCTSCQATYVTRPCSGNMSSICSAPPVIKPTLPPSPSVQGFRFRQY